MVKILSREFCRLGRSPKGLPSVRFDQFQNRSGKIPKELPSVRFDQFQNRSGKIPKELPSVRFDQFEQMLRINCVAPYDFDRGNIWQFFLEISKVGGAVSKSKNKLYVI